MLQTAINYLEVPLFFAVFHGRFGAFIIISSPALGGAGSRYLKDYILQCIGLGEGQTRTGNIADGAASYIAGFILLPFLQFHEIGFGQPYALPVEYFPFMGEVEVG